MQTKRTHFPEEFIDLLNENGRQCVQSSKESSFQRADAVLAHESVICPELARDLIALLDEHIYPVLRQSGSKYVIPIPESYGEYYEQNSAPFSCRLKAGNADFMEDKELFDRAWEIGLIKLIRSSSLLEFIKKATGLRLRFGNGLPLCQFVCYEHRDYVGLHSDWSAPRASRPDFLTFQLNLLNEFVLRHCLIYQQGEYLTGIVEHTGHGIGLMHLPMWHMTTPLEAKAGGEREARRWLVSAAFSLA